MRHLLAASIWMLVLPVVSQAQTASRPIQLQPASAPAGPLSVAVLEADVQADMTEADRKTVAGTIDTMLSASLAGQSGLVIVDRQALDKVLAEKAAKAGGATKVAPGEVGAELRPFWSAGVLVCPTVVELKPDKPSPDKPASGRPAPDKGKTPPKGPELVIEVTAVLAQTGQPLGEAHVVVKWQNHNWDKPPELDEPLKALWAALPGGLRLAQESRYIEIADVRLTSSLRRLQWMADDLGDSLRASLSRPGVSLLRPRHPMSTKEERLLRVMGLSAVKAKDATASLACSPDYRLDVELAEEPGKELDYEKTPIKIHLSLQGRQGQPLKETFSGMASEYVALSAGASAWMNKQLSAGRSTTSEAQDQEYSRQLAQTELEAVRELLKACYWYQDGFFASVTGNASLGNMLRVKVLERALRAAHLDPTSEEAQRLVVLGMDSPYFLRGEARSAACADRVIAEGQRYLDRFAKSAKAEEVRLHMSNAAGLQLHELRMKGPGDWISLPYNPDICRYAKVEMLRVDYDIRHKIKGNLWPAANTVGECILGHCPPDRLEEERTYWRTWWKKTIEPLGADTPPWEFIDLSYFIRKKDCPGMRDKLNELARRYPRSHENIWWGTRPYPTSPGVTINKPCWKVRVETFLKLVGDKEWQTWEPAFGGETYAWNPWEYNAFLGRYNPPMPPAWEASDARPLPADHITLESDAGAAFSPATSCRPILSAGGSMWLRQTAKGEKDRQTLLVASREGIEAQGKDLRIKVAAIDWPAHPSDGQPGVPGQIATCWAATEEDKVPAVWIGTAWHGLARFDFKDGKWQGRWYTSKDGAPSEDILQVRSCLHEGKPRILVLSQPRAPAPRDGPKHLWALDPASGQITSIASKPYMGTLAVWKDGTKVSLDVYSRDDFPKLDAAGIVDLKQEKRSFVLAHEGSAPRVWSFGEDGLTQLDARMSAKRLLDAAPLKDSICYQSPGLKTENFTCTASFGGLQYWYVMQAPAFAVQCVSDEPAMVWGISGGLLMAYRPADKSPAQENDAWYGPWRGEGPLHSVDNIDGYLWRSSSGANLQRCKPSAVVQSAQTDGALRTTAQWSKKYREKLESPWINAVRANITAKEYDKALSLIAEWRRKIPAGAGPSTPPGARIPTGAAAPASTPSSYLGLWEALALARKGDFPAADRLYVQLADDTKAEPLVRGMALVNLINVRHAAKDWAALPQATDKFLALFPDMGTAGDFKSGTGLIQWFRQEAQRGSSASQPAGTAEATSRPVAAGGGER